MLCVCVCVCFIRYTAKARFELGGGKCKYDSATNMLVWKLKRFPGGQNCTLFADVELVSTLKERKAWVQVMRPFSLSLSLSLSFPRSLPLSPSLLSPSLSLSLSLPDFRRMERW